MENIRLQVDEHTGIIESTSPQTNAYGYRFFPDKIKGEGFYLACFRKKTGEAVAKNKSIKTEKASARELAIVQPWIKEETPVAIIKKKQSLYAFPEHLLPELSLLQATLQVVYAGVELGEVMKDKLVPAHALALSTILSSTNPSLELTYEEAIKYLQKSDLKIEPKKMGWQVVTYKKHNLGWINALSNRINNYYPKEMRILKQQNNGSLKK